MNGIKLLNKALIKSHIFLWYLLFYSYLILIEVFVLNYEFKLTIISDECKTSNMV
jgi:hypothetical protein